MPSKYTHINGYDIEKLFNNFTRATWTSCDQLEFYHNRKTIKLIKYLYGLEFTGSDSQIDWYVIPRYTVRL